MRQPRPLVSVIMPIYNCEQYLKEAIDSVLSQTYEKLELIIVDDASTDNSLKIAKKYSKKDKRVKIFVHKKNKKRAAAINTGFKHARGEYITFHDGDDIMFPGRIKKQVEFLNQHPEIDGIYGNIIIYREEEETAEFYDALEFKAPLITILKRARKKDLSRIKGAAQILHKNKYIPSTSWMIRRKIIDDGLRMDETLVTSQDCDFALQMIGRGYKLVKYPIITYIYRRHPNQITVKKKKERKKDTKKVVKKLKEGIYFQK